jgi:hypothetical protein
MEEGFFRASWVFIPVSANWIHLVNFCAMKKY